MTASSPPLTLAEANRRALERTKRMTSAEMFALTVQVGIYTPEGVLTPEYGGPERGEAK